MGLVRRLGRRLDRGDGDRVRPYVCVSCEGRFERQHHVCPACGGYSVERVRWQYDEPVR